MAEVTAPPSYEIVIQPSRGWLRIDCREMWEYRDLLVLLVQRDFISRYKQTILGPLWHLLQPVMNAAIYFVIFTLVAGVPTDGFPQPLYYLTTQLAWNYFAQNVTTGGATFINNAGLFGKVYFPRLIVPASVIVANLISVGLGLVPFVLCFAYYKFFTVAGATLHITPLLLLAPLPIIQTALLSLGVSLWMSASTAKYRDLVHLNQYIIQVWMLASPVIWALSQVPAKWHWVALLNPMIVPIEALRICLLGRGALSAGDIAVSVVMTLLILLGGIAVFQKVEKTVVDSV